MLLPGTSGHILVKNETGKWHCPACNWLWQGLGKKVRQNTRCEKAIPLYDWYAAPDNLKVEKELGELGLKPGGPPRGCLWYSSSDKYIWLFDVSEAQPKPPLSEKRKAAIEKARTTRQTCHICKENKGYNLSGSICEDCQDRLRRKNVGKVATEWLEKANSFVILDTETTGLGYAHTVEIAVIDLYGNVLFSRRIKPPCAIEETAVWVHGITEEMLADCPTFDKVYSELWAVLSGKTGIITYNADFDYSVLRYDCDYHNLASLPVAQENWHCAMLLFAKYVGEWSDYYGGYRYQSLPLGNHTALGDSLGTLELIREMAQTFASNRELQ